MPSVTRIVKFIRKGEKGDNGRSVLAVDVEYAQSSSNVNAPTSGWETDAPAWIDGKYIWTRTRIDYSDGDPEYTDPVCITGGKGNTGESVVDIVEEYYRSTSPTLLLGGSWSTARWGWIDGTYMWTRSHVIMTDRDYYTTPICVSGARGTNAVQYYTWIRYADTAEGAGISDSPFHTDEDGETRLKAYIGFAYNKTTRTESNDPRDYKWALFKGTDGADGIDGADGEDGKSFYTWIKYADAVGSNGYPTAMYDKPTTATVYIGIAVNKTTQTEGSDPKAYAWSKFRGDDGTSVSVDGVVDDWRPNNSGYDKVDAYVWAIDSPFGLYWWDEGNETYRQETVADGKMYLVGSVNDNGSLYKGHLLIAKGGKWVDLGNLQGPQGPQGPQGEDGPQGPQGENGVTFEIVPSVAHLSADANGNITTSYIAISAYRCQNGKRTSLVGMLSMAGEAYYYVQYSVDGGSWQNCGNINIGEGVYQLLGYGVAKSRYSSASKGIAFRLMHSDSSSSVFADYPQMGIIRDGKKGEVGPALRGPQDWESLPVGYQFYKGALGEPFKDVVYFNGQYYSCTESHTKADGRGDVETNSAGVESLKTENWTLGEKMEMVATKILLAAYAVIKNLGVQNVVIGGNGYSPDNENGEIVMLDASNKILFQVKNGKVIANTGTFNDVVVQSGKIAGFTISGNGLSNDPFTNDAYVIFRNDSKKAFAGIGGNVLPTSSGLRAVARFENEDTSDQWGIGANYALILSAKNAARNYAFKGSGNGILDGYIAGFSFHKYTIAAANTIHEGDLVLNLKKSNQFIVHCEYGNSGVCLPKLSAVYEALGISSGTNFCLKITIISDLSNTQNWVVYGRNKKKSSSNTYPWNTEQLPLLTHWDGSNWDDCPMGSGDSLQIMLVYDSSRTQTINGYTTKYTARIINRQD